MHRLKASSVSAVALALVLASGAACAQLFDRDFEDQPWAEQVARIPAYPKPENLVPIKLETMKSFEVAIDASSLDIGSDGVIRYVLVARSGGGSENISFEGIRCEKRERKLYAIGRSDKTWRQVRNAAWGSYAGNLSSYHLELARQFFCPEFARVPSVADAIQNLKRGGYESPWRQPD